MTRRVIVWLQHDEGKLILCHDHRGYVVKLIGGYKMRYADIHAAIEELV